MRVGAEYAADDVPRGLSLRQFPAVAKSKYKVPPEVGGQDGEQDQHRVRAGLLTVVDGGPEDRDEERRHYPLALGVELLAEEVDRRYTEPPCDGRRKPQGPLRIAEDPPREVEEDQEVQRRLRTVPDDPRDRVPPAEVPARQLATPQRLEIKAVKPQHRTEKHDRQQGKERPSFPRQREKRR